MTRDGILVLQCHFDTIWRLFTSWNIPGTEVTPAGFLVFLAFCGLVLRWLSRIFEVGMGADALTSVKPAAVPSSSSAPATGSFTFRRD